MKKGNLLMNLLMTELNKMFDDAPLTIIRIMDGEEFSLTAGSAKRILKNGRYEIVDFYQEPTFDGRLVIKVAQRKSAFEKNMDKIWRDMNR